MTYPPPPGDPHEAPTTLDPYGYGPGGSADAPPSSAASPPGTSPDYPAGYGAAPGYPQPGYPQPGYPQPGYPQPGYEQPGYQQPGYEQAGYQAAGYQQPGYEQPGYQAAGYQQPGYQQPGYQQPGYPQPGYQQPGYQQPGMPPPRRGNTGLIVGGVAGGIVLVLVLAVGAVVVLRATASDDPPVAPPPPGGEPLAPPPALDVPEEEPPRGGGSGTYTFVPDLCENLDLTPIFNIVNTPDSPADWGGYESEGSGALGSQTYCSIDLDDGSAVGSLIVQVMTYEDSAGAREGYRTLTDVTFSEPDSIEDLNTPWEEGQLWLGDSIAEEEAKVIAIDDNLAMSVDAWLFSAPGAQADLQVGVVEIAKDVLAVSAQ